MVIDGHICSHYRGHTKLHTSRIPAMAAHSTGHIWTTVRTEKMGCGDPRRPPPHLGYSGNGPYMACTVGCTWLMYSLCTA